jgi:hypothetical protein
MAIADVGEPICVAIARRTNSGSPNRSRSRAIARQTADWATADRAIADAAIEYGARMAAQSRATSDGYLAVAIAM